MNQVLISDSIDNIQKQNQCYLPYYSKAIAAVGSNHHVMSHLDSIHQKWKNKSHQIENQLLKSGLSNDDFEEINESFSQLIHRYKVKISHII